MAETTEKTNDTLRGATEEAVNKITLAKEQVISSVTGTAELSHTIHNWLATHPLISWGLHHPLRGLSIIRTESNAKLSALGVPIEPSEN